MKEKTYLIIASVALGISIPLGKYLIKNGLNDNSFTLVLFSVSIASSLILFYLRNKIIKRNEISIFENKNHIKKTNEGK
ncbi:hypothetical protein LPTSP2_33920 [Leptospira ellinghausenii]|uniref:Uncharacterized protein n=1 Tax=Leptospira ellinghausenii TaxID=1917822 RepID=A0A2P2DHL6_9LEPT|nr:hypothetical protein [Leptospira ellinghausenii]GBF44089.1 hypothetical protein LPTSP2_33920 [Leptospira ellinghausenii]